MGRIMDTDTFVLGRTEDEDENEEDWGKGIGTVHTPLPPCKPVLSVHSSVLPSDFALLTRTKAVRAT